MYITILEKNKKEKNMEQNKIEWKDIEGYEGLYKISNCCQGQRKQAYGYKWRYINDKRRIT